MVAVFHMLEPLLIYSMDTQMLEAAQTPSPPVCYVQPTVLAVDAWLALGPCRPRHKRHLQVGWRCGGVGVCHAQPGAAIDKRHVADSWGLYRVMVGCV